MNQPVGFIYFDLGNVVLHFDHELACKNVAALTGVSASYVRQIVFESSLQVEYETGKLGSAEFAERFAEASGTQSEPGELLYAVSNVFSLNRKIVPVLSQLRAAGVPIGILSNTCEAHWSFIKQRFPILPMMFEKQYQILSFESKSMKPDAKIFQDSIAAAKLSAENVFFVDDVFENVEGARAQSLQAEVFESTSTLIRQLSVRDIRTNA